MAMNMNSPKSNNYSTTLSPRSVKGMGQLGLSQRISKLRKTSLTAEKRSWLVHGMVDTESIIRRSQIVRAQLAHAVSTPVSNAVADTEEKKKAMEILQAKLLCASAFAPTTSLPPRPTDNGVTLCPSPLSVCFAHEDNDSKYDGRMHSYPYRKNGPYTCPKCGQVFETSQRFAAHVSSSHYKYESKSERKKRLMAKIRRRNFRIEWVSGGLTVVPDDDHDHAPNNNVPLALALAPPPVRIKVEGENGVELTLAPPPGWDKLTGPGPGPVKIKLEPVDA